MDKQGHKTGFLWINLRKLKGCVMLARVSEVCYIDYNEMLTGRIGRGGENAMYKNIEKQTKLQLKELVEYRQGQVVSKTLVQNDLLSMTIFSFDKGEEISTHAAAGDAMVTVLEGTGRFTVGGEVFFLNAGETLIMPKDIPHAVYGETQFKMQLVVSY